MEERKIEKQTRINPRVKLSGYACMGINPNPGHEYTVKMSLNNNTIWINLINSLCQHIIICHFMESNNYHPTNPIFCSLNVKCNANENWWNFYNFSKTLYSVINSEYILDSECGNKSFWLDRNWGTTDSIFSSFSYRQNEKDSLQYFLPILRGYYLYNSTYRMFSAKFITRTPRTHTKTHTSPHNFFSKKVKLIQLFFEKKGKLSFMSNLNWKLRTCNQCAHDQVNCKCVPMGNFQSIFRVWLRNGVIHYNYLSIDEPVMMLIMNLRYFNFILLLQMYWNVGVPKL